MNREFLRTLGGVSRFIEVSNNPTSTPRDRLLAKRTWRHRQLVTLSEFSQSMQDSENGETSVTNAVDEQISVLNALRLADPPDLAAINSAYSTILRLFLQTS